MKIEKIIKFVDIEIQKQNFHQNKKTISIKNIDINIIVVSDTVPFSKTGFKYFVGHKDAKNLDIYVYFSPKWVLIEKTLMKLNTHIFL